MITRIMTPGPTQVPEPVRIARSLPCGNPDLDETFADEYRDTCRLISRLLDTENETLILSGEGILGLEAACASLTEPGDRVLVLGHPAHYKAHNTDDDKGKGSPCRPAGQQIEQTHADAAGQCAGLLAEENGADEQGDISQVNKSAVRGDRKTDVNKCGEYVGQCDADGCDHHTENGRVVHSRYVFFCVCLIHDFPLSDKRMHFLSVYYAL